MGPNAPTCHHGASAASTFFTAKRKNDAGDDPNDTVARHEQMRSVLNCHQNHDLGFDWTASELPSLMPFLQVPPFGVTCPSNTVRARDSPSPVVKQRGI